MFYIMEARKEDAMGHDYQSKRARCEATRKDGQPCRAWAVRGSDPPRCAAHRGRAAPQVGRRARPGGEVAGQSLDPTIAELARRLDQVCAYIDEHMAELDHSAYARLAALQGTLSARLGQLMRERRELAGGVDEELIRAIYGALDELSAEWGVEL